VRSPSRAIRPKWISQSSREIVSHGVVYESRVLVRLDSGSVDHGGQPSGLIVSEQLQAFKLHVTALQTPLVTLLEQQRTDEIAERR
jgi:hypothetical protein